MKLPIRRRISRSCVALLLVGGLAFVAAGCGVNSEDYVSYRELEADRSETAGDAAPKEPESHATGASDDADSAIGDSAAGDAAGVANTEPDDGATLHVAANRPAENINGSDRVDVEATDAGGNAPDAVSPRRSNRTESARSPEAEAVIRALGGGANGASRRIGSGPFDLAVEEEPAEPREIELLVPEKKFQVEGPQDAIRVHYSDFDLLEVLNMAPVPANAVEHFPSWLNELDGRRVRVRGFMFPTYQEEGLRQFVLARDNDICCFVRKPKVYDVLTVKMRDGVTTRYISNRPFDVVGIFRISPFSFEGEELDYLYAIEDAVVINK